jgi:proprotein convertase subtilisin/kexin type 5
LDPCLTCTGTGTNCNSCTSSTFYISLSHTCTTTCPNGYYGNTSTNICDLCHPFCTVCTGPLSTQCSMCANYSGITFFLSENQCLSICPNGTFANTSTNQC